MPRPNHAEGTFARVWLARFRGQTSQCKSKVFALKILRKVDSRSFFSDNPTSQSRLYLWTRTDLPSAVIRLKQIEHIRNERNTLSAVAGHPFITTLITSFSDRDCLYMVVRMLPLAPLGMSLSPVSLTTALAARSSRI